MITNKKTAAGGNRQAGNICTFNAPDYKQISLKINVLRNILALEDAALLALLALILCGVMS
jgi:hypothetical protein